MNKVGRGGRWVSGGRSKGGSTGRAHGGRGSSYRRLACMRIYRKIAWIRGIDD